jgi:prevent-host-death family protein
MMKKISVREAKAYISRMLEQVSSGKLSLKEAKSNLARFVDHIDSGEEIIITRDGEPIARLVPVVDE